MKRRLITFVLAVCMLASSLGLIVQADGGISGSFSGVTYKELETDIPAAAYRALDNNDPMSEVVGTTDEHLDSTFDGFAPGVTNMGNLFTDAMRDYTGAEIAMAPTDYIGGDIRPGVVTKGDIQEIAKVENLVVTIRMKGADIKSALLNSWYEFPLIESNFLQMSGISYMVDVALGYEGIFAIAVNGRPLDENATYTVACLVDMYEDMDVFKKGTLVKEWDNTAVILEAYFRKYQTVSPEIYDRIAFIGSSAKSAFTDINEYEWYYLYVSYAYDNGLMNGTTATTFEPSTTMSRGMFATVIYRIIKEKGADMTVGPGYFSDVKVSDYYYNAITWAYNNGIIEGVGNGKFAPDSPITREQAVTILGRMIVPNDEAGTFNYTDAATISNWAREFVDLLSYYNLVGGYPDGTFRPKNNISRAEATKILSLFDDGFSIVE